jgi:hypothetical protein
MPEQWRNTPRRLRHSVHGQPPSTAWPDPR